MFYLALGYFISYLPYAILAKALSGGIVPGVDAPVGGLVLLPAAALYAAGVGVLYEVLFIFGTLIYLDVRGHARCGPVNRVSMLFSGMAASYLLVAMAGLAPPGNGQLIAVVFVVGAVVALFYPALRGMLRGTEAPERMVLFVCGGNQSRSAMAKWFARAVMASTRSGHRLTIASAGVRVHTSGAPMTSAAAAILQEAGIIPHRPRSRPLTPEMCRRADVIYCMTAEHRAAVLALAPDVADRVHCLAEIDIPEPARTSPDDHRRTAMVLQQAVRKRLAEQFS